MRTLVIFGPGGVGKSPLDGLLPESVLRVEPHRLRPNGPRDKDDVLYGHPCLRNQLHQLLNRLGFAPCYPTPGIEWFPQAMTLFIEVRSEWQLLFLPQPGFELAKAEIYAPHYVELVRIPTIRHVFGELEMVILNPSHLPIGREPGTQQEEDALLNDLRRKTKENCILRGDTQEQAEKRASSVTEELPAWREAIRMGAKEFQDWPFPEYEYSGDNEKRALAQAHDTIVKRWPELSLFLSRPP